MAQPELAEALLPADSNASQSLFTKCCGRFLRCLVGVREVPSNRVVWKTVCSVLLVLEASLYFYYLPPKSLLTLSIMGGFFLMKSLVETWGQDTPTWVCPATFTMLLGIYILILPGVVYIYSYCTKTSDIEFAYRNTVALVLYFFGSGYSLSYEVGRFRWKAKPENKGKLHTVDLAKYCIHPNYFGDLFTYSGWAFASGTLCALSTPLFMLWSFWILVIPSSDAYLGKRYPAEFNDYAERTATLIPYLRSNMGMKILAWGSLIMAVLLQGKCNGPCGY